MWAKFICDSLRGSEYALQPARLQRTDLFSKLFRRADRRAPLRSIRFFLEMGAGEKLLRQILRIVDDRADDQQCLAVRFRDLVKILGEHRIGAVWHSILAQVSR